MSEEEERRLEARFEEAIEAFARDVFWLGKLSDPDCLEDESAREYWVQWVDGFSWACSEIFGDLDVAAVRTAHAAFIRQERDNLDRRWAMMTEATDGPAGAGTAE